MLNKETLSKHLCYDPISGNFIRVGYFDRWGNYHKLNRTLNSVTKEGYLVFMIAGKPIKAHQAAFILMYDCDLTDKEIDHIDGNRANNSFVNLRLVDRKINMTNKGIYKNTSTGVIGVSKYDDKYRARINVNGVRISLGLFDIIEAAALARKQAEIKHNYHENHGSHR